MSADDPKGVLSAAEMLGDAPTNLEAAVAAAEGDGLTEQDRLDGVDANHLILTVQEQREAIATARARVDTDEKKEALKSFEKTAYEKMRGKGSMRTGDPRKDQMVYVTVDLPEFCDKLTINFQPYWHGCTYPLQRHVAEGLREMAQRAWQHQSEIDGKGLVDRMRTPHVTHIQASGQVLNAPSKNVAVA